MDRTTRIAATFALAVGTAGAGFFAVRGAADPAAESGPMHLAAESGLAGLAVSALVLLRGRGRENDALKTRAAADAARLRQMEERNHVALEVYKADKKTIARQNAEIRDLHRALGDMQGLLDKALADDVPDLPLSLPARKKPGPAVH